MRKHFISLVIVFVFPGFGSPHLWIEQDGNVCDKQWCELESKAFEIHMRLEQFSDLHVHGSVNSETYDTFEAYEDPREKMMLFSGGNSMAYYDENPNKNIFLSDEGFSSFFFGEEKDRLRHRCDTQPKKLNNEFYECIRTVKFFGITGSEEPLPIPVEEYGKNIYLSILYEGVKKQKMKLVFTNPNYKNNTEVFVHSSLNEDEKSQLYKTMHPTFAYWEEGKSYYYKDESSIEAIFTIMMQGKKYQLLAYHPQNPKKKEEQASLVLIQKGEIIKIIEGLYFSKIQAQVEDEKVMLRVEGQEGLSRFVIEEGHLRRIL